jgi:8-oxo-dGTP diphosphatase
MERKRKVLAYVTNRGRLLLFTHPLSPEAGIQVPAGTLRPDESPEDGVLREAWEETGLEGLLLGTYLGRQDQEWDERIYGRAEVHERYFFHVLCPGDPPDRWRHFEQDPSEGEEGPIPFDFFWAPLPDGVPPLIAEQDVMLPRLREALDYSPDT